MQSPEVEDKEAELDAESERMPEEGFEEKDFVRSSDKPDGLCSIRSIPCHYQIVPYSLLRCPG